MHYHKAACTEVVYKTEYKSPKQVAKHIVFADVSIKKNNNTFCFYFSLKQNLISPIYRQIAI
jgi:hypothetical protein